MKFKWSATLLLFLLCSCSDPAPTPARITARSFALPKSVPATIILAWNPVPDTTNYTVAGYKIYVGTASGTYTNSFFAGNVTTAFVPNLTLNQLYFFAATTLSTAGAESPLSTEASGVATDTNVYTVLTTVLTTPLVQLQFSTNPTGPTWLPIGTNFLPAYQPHTFAAFRLLTFTNSIQPQINFSLKHSWSNYTAALSNPYPNHTLFQRLAIVSNVPTGTNTVIVTNNAP